MSRDRRVVASAAAIMTMSLGALVLVGWTLDLDTLKSLHPALASMKPNAAVAFILSGLALWTRRHDGAKIGLVGRVSAIVVLLIGAATLTEYAAGLDLQIDQLIFTDDATHMAPGRMAFAPALCFALVGAAMLTIDMHTKRWGRPAQWLALAIGALAFVVLVGYLYGVKALYATSSFASVALHTAIAILILCVGILYARPTVGIMRVMTLEGSPVSAATRRLVPVLIVLPIFFGWLRLVGQRAGLYHFEFGLAVFALSNVIVVTGLLWWTAAAQLRLELATRDASEALNERTRAQLAERVQSEGEVREREQSLATTLDSIGDAVIVTDPAGVVVRMNPIAEVLTGWNRSEATGQSLRDVFHIVNEETRTVVESPVERVLREGRIVGLANHTVLLSRAGTERPIADSAAPIVDKDSTIRGVVLVFRDMTSEREAQRSIVASEQRYRDLYENSPDMYLTAGWPSEEVLDCNRTLCVRLGYENSELVGKPFYTVYHPDYLAEATKQRASFQELGEFEDVERRLRCKDGSSVEVSLNLRAVRDATGRVVAARAVWRDITKRKQTERDSKFLFQVSETLRTSTDANEIFSAVSTLLGEHVRVARCLFAEIDTYKNTVTIDRDFHAGVPSATGTLPLSSFARDTAAEAARGITVVNGDTATDPRTAASYEAAYRPASVRASLTVPLLRQGHWVAALIVASAEVRAWEQREVALVELVAERVWLSIEHIRAVQALSRSEARATAILGSAFDAIISMDHGGAVVEFNRAAETLFGYKRSEVLGRPMAEIVVPPSLRDAHVRGLGRYLETGEGRVLGKALELRAMRADGSEFPVELAITRVEGEAPPLFTGFLRDVTERKRAEQDKEELLGQLRVLNAGLEERVRERTAALTTSLKEREVLLQEVHHRVKNNLQVISSLINMQVRKLDLGSTRDALVECQTRVQTIALIHEKLYQSKDYAQVRFAEYARSLAANVFHATGLSQQDVSLELSIDEIPLGIDRAIPCGLVINELIANSLKHGFKDGHQGTIWVELTTVADGKLRLTVRDDGLGLPAGFDIQKVQSMGLQLVCTLSEQLDAVLVVDGSSGGASFALTFTGSG